jgi:hypothetical protein
MLDLRSTKCLVLGFKCNVQPTTVQTCPISQHELNSILLQISSHWRSICRDSSRHSLSFWHHSSQCGGKCPEQTVSHGSHCLRNWNQNHRLPELALTRNQQPTLANLPNCFQRHPTVQTCLFAAYFKAQIGFIGRHVQYLVQQWQCDNHSKHVNFPKSIQKMSSRPGVSPEISLHLRRSTLQIQKAQTCPMPWQIQQTNCAKC